MTEKLIVLNSCQYILDLDILLSVPMFHPILHVPNIPSYSAHPQQLAGLARAHPSPGNDETPLSALRHAGFNSFVEPSTWQQIESISTGIVFLFVLPCL
jgi:hypothetical protein